MLFEQCRAGDLPVRKVNHHELQIAIGLLQCQDKPVTIGGAVKQPCIPGNATFKIFSRLSGEMCGAGRGHRALHIGLRNDNTGGNDRRRGLAGLRSAPGNDTNQQGEAGHQQQPEKYDHIFEQARLTTVQHSAGNGRIFIIIVKRFNPVMNGVHMGSPFARNHILTARKEDENERLDRFLAAHIEGMSRSRLKTLIKEGQVSFKGATLVEPNHRVKCGEQFALTIPEVEDAIPKAENIPLDVVHEDEHLIVVDKPAGMVVHPAAGNWNRTLVNALLFHCGDSLSGIGGVRRPGIVHRLDKETSGLLVVAKNDRAHAGLSAQFADHGRTGPLTRAYLALVWGAPARTTGTINAPLARSPHNRQKIAVVSERQAEQGRGKFAITHYELLEKYFDTDGMVRVGLVRCRLETGRTHQIRVHMAHIHHPLLGDDVYGAGFRASARNLPEPARHALTRLNRQALHAAELGFAHPITGREMRFESPLPKKMQRLIDNLR